MMTDDLISRKALLEELRQQKKACEKDYEENGDESWICAETFDDAIMFVKAAPEIKPEYVERAHGYWEKMKPDALVYWRCSACQKVHYLEEPRDAFYCPGCGARMDKETK